MRELESFFKTVGEGLRTLAQGVNAIADKLDGLSDVGNGQRSKPDTKDRPDREVKTETPKAKTAGERAKKTTPQGKKEPPHPISFTRSLTVQRALWISPYWPRKPALKRKNYTTSFIDSRVRAK